MKRIFTLLLALVLCVALFACGEEPCTAHTDQNGDGKCDICGTSVKPEGGNGGEKGDTGGDLVLVSGKKTGFAIVVADSLTSKAEDYVNAFIKALNKYYLEDGDLAINYDAPGFDDAVEIIFGAPNNRGEQFKKDEHYLGYKGFSIELIGNKLFVLGGGDKGYQDAIKYLENTLFDLEGYADTIDELVVPAGTKYESIPTDYSITQFTVGGTDISEFVIAYNNSSKDAKAAATTLRNTIYKDAGIWLKYVSLSEVKADQKAIYVENTKGDKGRTTDEGFTVYVKDGDLHIECEFENKFEDAIYAFIDAKISSGKVSIDKTYAFKKDVRNIYYEDFGAVGDGETDDFFAIKACHEYANLYGHTVNGTQGATYYIGIANGTESIPVKTDTYLNLCSFIWDDRDLPEPWESNAYMAPIFEILPEKGGYTLTGSKLPATSLLSGATTIGDWKPEERVLISIYDNTKRHYIRYGSNQNNGTAQREIIIVNPDGTIDPSTPVEWDFTTLYKMEVYPADDAPIVFSGGYKGQSDPDNLGRFDNFYQHERAKVYTYFNESTSTTKYFERNITITRSNVTVKNIEHILYDDVEQSASYTGFIYTECCSDILVEGMVFQKQKQFTVVGANGSTVTRGSYEINATACNNITWRHCRQSNFFEPDGSTKSRGSMGSNYCKNLTFDDVVNCSFDAHRNLYNGRIINSTCEHLNFIGSGTILYENVTVYTDGNHAAIILRQDYGSTWRGNVIVNGLTIRTSKDNDTISLIRADYVNHDFGYTCYLPERIEINDVKIIQYTYEIRNGVRYEWDLRQLYTLHLYSRLEKYTMEDISSPDADMSRYTSDRRKCNCAEVYGGTKSFNDTDGDGYCNNDRDPSNSSNLWCWGTEGDADNTTNLNPYVPTKEVYVNNCGDLVLIIPQTPQFEDTKLYIDGKLQN